MKANNQANFTEREETSDEILFYGCNSTIEEDSTQSLNSGCSHHMLGNAQLFLDVDDSVAISKTWLGMGELSNQLGKAELLLKLRTKFIQDVLLAPNLKQNLLGMGNLW